MNLAVAAQNSMIIDTDSQASCADWGDRRNAQPPEVITVPASRVRVALKKCQTDWVFIDTQPSAEASLIEIAQESDICVIVLRPGQLELDALGATLAAVRAAEARAVFCINQAHPQANLTELVTGLENHHQVGSLIRSRADFPASVAEGMSVIKWNPEVKATLEILNYWSWLKEQLV